MQGCEGQTQALQAVFQTINFHHVRSDVFQSTLLHFVAVLGIDDNTDRLRRRGVLRAMTLERKGIHNWHAAIRQHAPVTPVSNQTDSTWWSGQSSQAASTHSNDEEVMEQRTNKAVLGCEEFSFKSEEQKAALHAIVGGSQRTLLAVVLPTRGAKSRLFMAPACLDGPRVTIVVVPL